MSLYIVTLNEMKAELGIPDSEEDDVLTRWLEGLQSRFDGFLKRVLLRDDDVTEYFDGGERYIYVDNWPVESISSIIIDSDQDWSSDDALDDDDYRVKNSRGRIGYGVTGTQKWPEGNQHIRVVYTGGYLACTETPGENQYGMPEAIRRAMFMQAGFEWRNRKTLGVTQISAGGAAKQVGAGVALALKGKTLMPEVEETLLPYKRIL